MLKKNCQKDNEAGHRGLQKERFCPDWRFGLLLAAIVCIFALLSWMVYMFLVPGDIKPAGDARTTETGAFEHVVADAPEDLGNMRNAGDNEFSGSAQMEPRGHLDRSQCPKDWNLLLVNPWNSLTENPDIERTQLSNGHSVDSRCYPDLQDMMDDCRAAGLSPTICSSYRTWETQQSLFDANVNKLTGQGYSKEDAEKETAKAIAVPGTSEHQLGLALDIVDVNNQNLDETQEDTPVQQWLMKNSWRYGFILRYPNDKSDITGIIYEPWHYRYVGKDIARQIYDADVCLEEYLEALCTKG